jgi:hypothetical protein
VRNKAASEDARTLRTRLLVTRLPSQTWYPLRGREGLGTMVHLREAVLLSSSALPAGNSLLPPPLCVSFKMVEMTTSDDVDVRSWGT